MPRLFGNLTTYFRRGTERPSGLAFEFLKYVGPGLLVTIGFTDPGNWASNFAAGSTYGYALLWMVTLATVMLIVLQHNVAHLGIATGLCLAEAVHEHFPARSSRLLLLTAMAASVSTSLAEILGGAIALRMLFHLPLKIGAVLVVLVSVLMLYTNSYRRLERWIIAFLAVVGFSFLYELFLVQVDWPAALVAWVKPELPAGSMVVVMSVLGAVVMPHNLFLHSEIIQSRQWNLQDEAVIRKQLRFEFLETLFSMIVGWAINSAMILLAAATFFARRQPVAELEQAKSLLEPLLGSGAGLVFALALLFSGLSSTITSGMAAGTIMAGMSGESYDIQDRHTRRGVLLSFLLALLIIFVITNPFAGLIFSQMILSMQLPFTIFAQIRLTSSARVMGKYANTRGTMLMLYALGGLVTLLNLFLLASFVPH
ncbi:MAG: Nramp family divalent metal transporter [candidate division FCPU426 bacterium]